MHVNMVDFGAAVPAGTGPPVDGHGGADFVLLLQQLLGASGRDREGSRGGAAGLAAGLSSEGQVADADDVPGTSSGDGVALLAALMAAPGGRELLASWAGQDVTGQLAGLAAQGSGDGEGLALAWGRWLASNPRLAAYLEQLAAVLARSVGGGVPGIEAGGPPGGPQGPEARQAVPLTMLPSLAGGSNPQGQAGAGLADFLGGQQQGGESSRDSNGTLKLAVSRESSPLTSHLAPLISASPAGVRAGALLAGVSQGVASQGAGAQPGATLAAGGLPGSPQGPEAGQVVPFTMFPSTAGGGNPQGQAGAGLADFLGGQQQGGENGRDSGGILKLAGSRESSPLTSHLAPLISAPLPGLETAIVGWPKAADFILTWLVQKGQLIRQGQRTALELHLRPEALGVLRLEVISEGGRLLGHLLVQNQAAHQWVQSNLMQLQHDLNHQGLHFDEFRVDVAGGGANWGGPAQQQSYAGSGEDTAAGRGSYAGGMVPESQSLPGAGAIPVGLIDYLV